MGAPITFSGFNSIDFGAVLNLVMQQERAPLTRLQAQQTELRTQSTAFSTFASKLGAFQSAVQALGQPGSLDRLAASSSDTARVGVTTLPGSIEGAYEVVVSALARPQVMRSETTWSGLQDVVADSGVLRITGAGGPVEMAITEPTTLQQLAERVNALPDRPVTAAIVQTAPGSHALVFTATAPGTAHAFTVEVPHAFSGGTGLAFTDTTGDGVSGTSPADSAQVATDAMLTVNNIAITSHTNVIDGAIPAVRLTLGATTPDPVTVTVARDTDAVTAQVEKVMTAYNDLVSFIEAQTASAAEGRPSIARDPMVRGLRDALRTATMGAYGDGVFTRLPEIGLGFDRSGRMVLDRDTFTHVAGATPDAVQSLFTGAFTSMGGAVMAYTQAGGLVASARDRITAQVAALDRRMAALEAQLEVRRLALQQEFLAADRAMSQLNSQGDSLFQLANQYRLF